MIWCGSTEVYHEAAAVHATLKNFECGLQKNDPEISPSQIYAYAALKSGVAVRQRRAAHDHRHAGADGAGAQDERAGGGQGLQERPDVHEDADGAGPEIAHAGPERLVLDEHPGESRWRSAGRSGVVPLEGSDQVVRRWSTFCRATCTRTCTRSSTTRSGSSIIRRAATPKKAGTTSTFSGGWATRCRSRSISCAAIRFWRRR